MTPDVLFWFYKDFGTCRSRLQDLREQNAGIRVFALYGGPLSKSERARIMVGDLVDDFYAFPEKRTSKWKWRNGDQLIARWYKERGRLLDWNTVFVMQWDMLILDPLEKLFRELRPEEILLSGFRPIRSVTPWWFWSNPRKSDLMSFKNLLRSRYRYEGELFACLFIVICFPRRFLQKYVDAGHPETGFLEYKIPTLARLFGIPVCTNHGFDPWWRNEPATRHVPPHLRLLNADRKEIPSSVLRDAAGRDVKKLFHPVYSCELPIVARDGF